MRLEIVLAHESAVPISATCPTMYTSGGITVGVEGGTPLGNAVVNMKADGPKRRLVGGAHHLPISALRLRGKIGSTVATHGSDWTNN